MIAIACDHAAYELKQQLIKALEKNYNFKDFGCFSIDSVDYPDYAVLASRAVASGECSLGILLCGTGIGMSIAANKIKGIRCALCADEFSARATKEHNDANMLAMGARIISTEKAISIAQAFLSTAFSQDQRHLKRIQKIHKLEE